MGKKKMNLEMEHLVRRLLFIQKQCLGDLESKSESKNSEGKTDEFLVKKGEIVRIMAQIRLQIEERDRVSKKSAGKNSEVIALSAALRKDYHNVKDNLLPQLQSQYDRDAAIFAKGGRKKKQLDLTQEELDNRRELIDLLRTELDNLINWDRSGTQTTKSFPEFRSKAELLADQSRGGRRGPQVVISEENHLDEETKQKFAQADAQMDEKLRGIGQGLTVLDQMARDMNTELQIQNKMLDELNDSVSNTTETLDKSSQRLKEIIEAYGGPERWCMKLFCLLILLAVLGYLYNLISNG